MESNEFFKDFEVEINGAKHKLKYNLQSWRLMESKGITPSNIESKMATEPMGTLAILLYFGVPSEVRETISMDKFCEGIDMTQIGEMSKIADSAINHGLPDQNPEKVGKSKKK
ncbi:MAG: hypothetical protein WCS77_00075 [Elusimicrobiaceae bacterium]|jgi:hypothetical protein